MAHLKKASALSAPIDLWDYSSFDDELRQVLEPHRQLIQDYFETDHAIFLSYDLGRGPGRSPIRPENPHASAYYDLLEEVNELTETLLKKALPAAQAELEELKTFVNVQVQEHGFLRCAGLCHG